MEKEYSACRDRLCKAGTVAQWTAISLGQDGAFASGMIAGVPASLYEAVEGLVKMGLSPVETFEAIKSLVMSGDIVGNVYPLQRAKPRPIVI